VSALDPAFVAQLLEDLTEPELRLVAESFGRDLDSLTAAMETAARAGDRDGFARHAHRLAGAAGAVGAAALDQRLRALCAAPPGTELRAAVAEIRRLGQAAGAALAGLAQG
jgi:HPt (histidine-containing phosphotransfer) domain-containing protein